MPIIGQANSEVPIHKDTGTRDPMHQRNKEYGVRNREITQNSEAFHHFIKDLAPKIHADPRDYFETAKKNPLQVEELRNVFSKAWASPEGKQMANSLQEKGAEERQANELVQIRNFLRYHDLATSIENAYGQYKALVSINVPADQRTAILKEKIRDSVFANGEYDGHDAYKKLTSHINQAGNSVLARDLISRARQNLSAMPEADQDLYRGFQLLDQIAQEGAPRQKPEVVQPQTEQKTPPETEAFDWVGNYADEVRKLDDFYLKQNMDTIVHNYSLAAETIDPKPGSLTNYQNNTLVYENDSDIQKAFNDMGAIIFTYQGRHTNYDQLADFMTALPSKLRRGIAATTKNTPINQATWKEMSKIAAGNLLNSGESEELVSFLMDVPEAARVAVTDEYKKDKQFGYVVQRLEEEKHHPQTTRFSAG